MCGTPLCDCGEMESVEHYVFYYSVYVRYRDHMKQSLMNVVSNKPLNVKLLFGAKLLQIVVKIVQIFLNNTSKIAHL